MLEIKNLHAGIGDKEILKGIDLTINAGEVHAIMGPNGSGKSTLSAVIAGNESFEVFEGDILFNGESILELSPDERRKQNPDAREDDEYAAVLLYDLPAEEGIEKAQHILNTNPHNIEAQILIAGWEGD